MGQKEIKILWTEPALEDVQNIHSFLARKSLSAADKQIERIFSKVDVLLTGFLKTGQEEALLSSSESEYRYLIQDHFKIIYRTFTNSAEIIAVFDTRQNPQSLSEKAE